MRAHEIIETPTRPVLPVRPTIPAKPKKPAKPKAASTKPAKPIAPAPPEAGRRAAARRDGIEDRIADTQARYADAMRELRAKL